MEAPGGWMPEGEKDSRWHGRYKSRHAGGALWMAVTGDRGRKVCGKEGV